MERKARVLSFLHTRTCSRDWTQQELGEFYRVESALLQNGLSVRTDRGLSDEGDPWFVFYRSENEEVIAHFARVDGCYLIASSAFSEMARGRDFKLLVRELMEAHPLMLPRYQGQGQKVFLHPSALLAALLATSYLISSDKDAVTQEISVGGRDAVSGFWSQLRQDFAIISAVTMAATLSESLSEFTFNLADGANSIADLALHTDHAVFPDHTPAQALQDNDITTPADLVQHFAREPGNQAHEPGSSTKLAWPNVVSPELTAALNISESTGRHAETVKDGHVAAFDAASLATAQMQPDPAPSAISALHSGSLFPIDASLDKTNDAAGLPAPGNPANIILSNQVTPNNQITPSQAGIAPADVLGVAGVEGSTVTDSTPGAGGTQASDSGTQESSAEPSSVMAVASHEPHLQLATELLRSAGSSDYSIAASMPSLPSPNHLPASMHVLMPAVDGTHTSNPVGPQTSFQQASLSTPSIIGAQTTDAFPHHAALHETTIADMQPHGIVGIIPHGGVLAG
jgi:hypothetical protein